METRQEINENIGIVFKICHNKINIDLLLLYLKSKGGKGLWDLLKRESAQ